MGKARRDAFSMLGGSVLRDQVDKGVAKRRVGLVVGKGAPARSHAVIADGSGKEASGGGGCAWGLRMREWVY